jgi:xylulokinase
MMMKSNPEYVITHDVGTTGVKSVLVSSMGEVMANYTSEYGFSYPNPGWVEQDPEDYWKGVVNNTQNLLDNSGINSSHILGILFSTQAMGIIPLNKQGSTLKNNITWVDGRAQAQATSLMNLLGGKKVFRKMIGVEITGKDVVPKLIWLKQNEPELYSQAETIVDVNGYLKYRATGRKVFEWSGACSYGFNLKKKDWERVVFKAAGVDLKKFPPLVRSTDVVGTLTPEAATELGLSRTVKVFGGCDDTQSAAVGSGSTGEGDAHIYLGTSAWAGITTGRNLKHRNGAVVLQSADASMNLLVGITESAGSNLDWMIEKFYKLEKDDPAIKNIYAFLNRETRGIPAGSDHLVFTPWLLGERCPVSTTTTRGTIFNLGPEHTRGHFVKALLEGVGYNLRWIFENYRRDFGFNPLKIRAIGGGSVNREWMQGIADITGMRVETTSQPTMAGAIGAATCAFVGNGTYKRFSDVNRFIQVKEIFDPNPATKEVYNALFSSYKNVYSGLKRAYMEANLERFGAI